MKTKITLMVLIFLGLLYRLCGLRANYSFWSDENHVAIFSRAILERGSPILENGYNTGSYQWLLYWVSAASMKIFGVSEFSARLPMVLFGELSILGVYLLGSRLFDRKVGLLSAFFITFLDIEILFSRQVRPYQALQFCWVLGVYFFILFLKNNYQIKNLIFSIVCGVISSFFHYLGTVFIFNILTFLFISSFWAGKLNKKLTVISIFIVPLFFFLCLYFRLAPNGLGQINTLFYYRVFLWHNYFPLVLFAFLGGLLLLAKKEYPALMLLVIFLVSQTFVASFLLSKAFIRYFYPVFPFLILLASYGIVRTDELLSKRISLVGRRKSNYENLILVTIFLLIVFVFVRKDKLSLFPKRVYSLNADMQEIPEVDWKKIYTFVDLKLKENPGALLVTNWNDLPVWYLGKGKLNYLTRINLVERDPVSFAKVINTLGEFQKMTKDNKKGIYIIDSWDDAVPEGIREYCQNNLKREFEIDRLYPVQPRYWTVWVYSWGMD